MSCGRSRAVLFLALDSFFLHGQASMEPYFDQMPIILLFFGPAIGMRLWAEERRSGTL